MRPASPTGSTGSRLRRARRSAAPASSPGRSRQSFRRRRARARPRSRPVRRETRAGPVDGGAPRRPRAARARRWPRPRASATGTRAHAGHVVMMLPNTDNATNATRTQPRLRAESVRRHHDSVTAPPCTRSASMSTTGIATKKSHDNDTTARANISATQGASNTPAMRVNSTLRRIVSAHGSGGRSCGHAARRRDRGEQAPEREEREELARQAEPALVVDDDPAQVVEHAEGRWRRDLRGQPERRRRRERVDQQRFDAPPRRCRRRRDVRCRRSRSPTGRILRAARPPRRGVSPPANCFFMFL